VWAFVMPYWIVMWMHVDDGDEGQALAS